MRLLLWDELGPGERAKALARRCRRSDGGICGSVEQIVLDIREGGWPALCDHALRIDKRIPEEIEVAGAARAARSLLSNAQIEAIEVAFSNITAFHEATRPIGMQVETMPGVRVAKVWRAIERVGLYVPGGRTPLLSSLLMLAIPARIAGVPELLVTSPPRPEGGLDPALAFAAELCGIESLWTVGGAQAIAALAFGAGKIAPVSKICGPGNAFVNHAKAFVARFPSGPAIDLPAGPSELMVIADGSADPRLVAADLLAQAEHDPSAQVLLVTGSVRLARQVEAQLERQIAGLPRANLALQALEGAPILIARSEDWAEIANAFAPEHLALAIEGPEQLIPSIRNAGAVFDGPHSAETFGDYLAGSSHVLPTGGAARAWSGIGVQSFMKTMTVQTLSEDAARALAAPAALLARLEGLEAHARAADLRGGSRS